MLVDPATGIPLDRPEATVGGEVGMNMLDRIGYDPTTLPLGYDILATLPGAATTTAWNMNRVSNTIIGGSANRGRRGAMTTARDSIRNGLNALQNQIPGMPTAPGRRISVPGQGGFLKQGFAQTANPGRFLRYSSVNNIDPPEGSKFYSPFGFVAGAGNRVFKYAAQRDEGLAAANKYLSMGQRFNTTEDAFTRGTFGRMASMARISSMSDRNLSRRAPNIAKAVSAMGGTTAEFGDDAFRVMSQADQLAVRRAGTMASIANTVTGQVSGRAVGFYAGAQSSRLGAAAVAKTLEDLGDGTAAKIGAQSAIKHYGAQGVKGQLARFAGSGAASGALRAAGPIGTLMLVRDAAMISGKILGAGAKTIADAGRSLTAPLNKGVMGSQFRDNSTAATSRQRGVMAIANSRLNMRSVLGHEAAAMQSYYG